MTDCICVNTLSELTVAIIPSGTESAMVQQFNSASAVSSALYILVPGNPGHPLSIQSSNAAKWWTIHPDYISLEAAGAPPVGGDCAPALKNVLLYFSAVGRVALKLWERDYILNSLSSLTAAPVNSGFAILGKGQTVSRLLVPYQANQNGALAVTYADTNSQFLLRDFSVIATGAGLASPVNCGTAILMNVNTGGAMLPKHQYGGIVERVHIGPEYDSNGNGLAYFNTALHLAGTPRPLVSKTTISGCDGPLAGNNYADTSPRYAAQTHIVLDECYSPEVNDTRLWNATTGVSYVCATTNAQGFVFAGCNMVGVRTGIYIRHMQPPNPNGRVSDNSIQFRDIGFDVGNIDTWRFAGNGFFLEGDIPRVIAYDMRFLDTHHVTVTGGSFGTFCGQTQNCGQRVNILIDANTEASGVAGGSGFLIDSSMFGDQTQYFALSAIQATPSAGNIQIGASNQFHGHFSGPVVDDQSGTAITAVGFPTGSAPATVVGNTAEGNAPSPTLGSVALPWPATFNTAHYVAQAGTAGIPAGFNGWVLYSDTSDGFLWAYNGSTSKKLAP